MIHMIAIAIFLSDDVGRTPITLIACKSPTTAVLCVAHASGSSEAELERGAYVSQQPPTKEHQVPGTRCQ